MHGPTPAFASSNVSLHGVLDASALRASFVGDLGPLDIGLEANSSTAGALSVGVDMLDDSTKPLSVALTGTRPPSASA